MKPSLLPAACALLLLACSGGRSQNTDGLNSAKRDGGELADAASEERNDAALQQDDARVEELLDAEVSSADAALDTGAPPPGVLKLAVTDLGVPVPRLNYVLHGDNDTVLATGSTDAEGKLETMLAPRALTVAVPSEDFESNTFNFVTYFAPKLGDDLRLDIARQRSDALGYLITVTPQAGATSYSAVVGSDRCASNTVDATSTELLLSANPRCLLASGNALLVTAHSNQASNAPLGYALLRDLPQPGATPYPVAATTFGPIRTASVSVSGFDPLGPPVQVDLEIAVGGTSLALQRESDQPLTGDGSAAFFAPSVPFDAFISSSRTSNSSQNYRAVRRRSADSTVADGIDCARCLPAIVSYGIENRETLRPTFVWGAAQSAALDGIILRAELFIYQQDSASQHTWMAIVPPDVRSVTLPALPPTLLPTHQASTPSVNASLLTITHSRSTFIDGYDGFRNQVLEARVQGYEEAPKLHLQTPGEVEQLSLNLTD